MDPLWRRQWRPSRKTSFSGPGRSMNGCSSSSWRRREKKGGKTKGVYQDHLKNNPGKGNGKNDKSSKGGRPNGWPQNWAPNGAQYCRDFHLKHTCPGNVRQEWTHQTWADTHQRWCKASAQPFLEVRANSLQPTGGVPVLEVVDRPSTTPVSRLVGPNSDGAPWFQSPPTTWWRRKTKSG